jgi:hypothetical protein
MKVSELLADLKNRADQAQIIVVESDAADNVFTIESVVGGNEKSVILMGKSTRVGLHPLIEASMREAGQIHTHKIFKSAMQRCRRDYLRVGRRTRRCVGVARRSTNSRHETAVIPAEEADNDRAADGD